MSDLNIKKQMELTEKKEREFSKFKEDVQCRCTHTKHGELTVKRLNNQGNSDSDDPKLEFICTQCRKKLSFARISEAALAEACKIIDQTIDIIKVTAETSREEDQKMVSKLAKIQYRVRNDLIPFYNASLKKNNRGRNNKKNNNNTGSGWNRPTTI